MKDYVSVLDKLLHSKMVVLAAQFLEVLKESGALPDTSHAFVLTEEIRLIKWIHLTPDMQLFCLLNGGGEKHRRYVGFRYVIRVFLMVFFSTLT